jgi:leader peptidase (prepilin peptidase)/N-methyltransferase
MSEETFILVMKLLIGISVGATLGSFITLLSYRMPRRLSIVAPRSACPSCKNTLQAQDLIPIASYLMHKGRCRMCHAPVSRRYLYIELFSTVAITAIVLGVGLELSTILFVVLFCAAFTAALIAFRV